MKRTLIAFLSGWIVVLGTSSGHPQASGSPQATAPIPGSPAARALVDKYCATCHNQRTKTGGLVLDTMDFASVPAGAETWEKVIR